MITCMFSCKFSYFYPHNGKGSIDQTVAVQVELRL